MFESSVFAHVWGHQPTVYPGAEFQFYMQGSLTYSLTVNSNRQVVYKYSLFYLFSIAKFGILICFVYYHTRLFSGITVKNNIETNMDVKGLFDIQPEHYC